MTRAATRREEATEFLFHEAELLDEQKFREWLDCLTDDVEYLMPVRITREPGKGPGFSDRMFHFEEDKYRLTKRVERLETGFAWAENPPSRTRHMVSNVRVRETGNENEIEARSYLLLYRTRGDESRYEILSAERQDRLRRVDGRWMLARRLILVDQSTLAVQNLSVFL